MHLTAAQALKPSVYRLRRGRFYFWLYSVPVQKVIFHFKSKGNPTSGTGNLLKAIGWMPVQVCFHGIDVFLFRRTGAWVVQLTAFVCKGRMNLDYSKFLMVLEMLHSRFLNIKSHWLYLPFCIRFLQITIKYMHWQTNQDSTTPLQKPVTASLSCWHNCKTLLWYSHISLQFFQQVHLLLQCHKDVLVKNSSDYTNITSFIKKHRRKQNEECIKQLNSTRSILLVLLPKQWISSGRLSLRRQTPSIYSCAAIFGGGKAQQNIDHVLSELAL